MRPAKRSSEPDTVLPSCKHRPPTATDLPDLGSTQKPRSAGDGSWGMLTRRHACHVRLAEPDELRVPSAMSNTARPGLKPRSRRAAAGGREHDFVAGSVDTGPYRTSNPEITSFTPSTSQSTTTTRAPTAPASEYATFQESSGNPTATRFRWECLQRRGLRSGRLPGHLAHVIIHPCRFLLGSRARWLCDSRWNRAPT
jgi:hypothetical protein